MCHSHGTTCTVHVVNLERDDVMVTIRPVSQAVRDRVAAHAESQPGRLPAGTLTYEQALTAGAFHHATQSQSGGACYRVRRNGRTQTWKTRPAEWSMPVRWGVRARDQFRITQDDAADWHAADTCPRCT